jgi:hypothetical protein
MIFRRPFVLFWLAAAFTNILTFTAGIWVGIAIS